jgi:hypothetical protein
MSTHSDLDDVLSAIDGGRRLDALRPVVPVQSAGPDYSRLVDRLYREARAAASELAYSIAITHALPHHPFLRPDRFRPGTLSIRFCSGEIQISRFLAFLETKLGARPAALVRLLGLTFHPDLALVQLTWESAPAFVRLSPLVASALASKRQATAPPEDAPSPKRGGQESLEEAEPVVFTQQEDLAPLLLPTNLLLQATEMADAIHDAFGLAETDDAKMLRPDHTTLVFVVPVPPVVSYEEWVACARRAQEVASEAVLYFDTEQKQVCVRWAIG